MRRNKYEKFERIYSDYKNTVLKISYIYLQDYHLAEDAASETFCKALEKIGSLKDEKKAKAWLSKICVNVCRDILRHKSRREISAGDKALDKESTSPDLDNTLTVTEAIGKLPEDIREAVILFYFQQFKQREIAEILKIPEKDVAYRIRKGKNLLREMLKEEFSYD